MIPAIIISGWHGGIAAHAHEHAMIKAAWFRIAGKWQAGRCAEHQLDMNAQRCDTTGCSMSSRTCQKVLEDRTFTITGPLQAEAKELSEGCRAIIRSAAAQYRVAKVVERNKTTGLESMTSPQRRH
ncbi:hypothetical protein A4A58_20795 [Tardiphaga robiniae]|uniref:Uncharacterized protein n=1 Tax=Tardiphaga robiniae TaxID=943830 RepID=A0A164AGP6_9BRAD|nr:hypothetical protein A4A58_20795 [Tardiphaga robiniae]